MSSNYNTTIEFLRKRITDTNSLEAVLTSYMRTSGIFWIVTSLYLLGDLRDTDRTATEEIILSAQNEDGGWGGAMYHDSHITTTASAIQALAVVGSLDKLSDAQKLKCCEYIGSLQQEDGSFRGDTSLEIDTRFAYCAVLVLKILNMNSLDAFIDVEKLLSWFDRCQNEDGVFGQRPDSESHGAQLFTVLAALKLINNLETLKMRPEIIYFIKERQTPSGGFAGRPSKKPDCCYSWWLGASLAILEAENYVDLEALRAYIFTCLDQEDGGFSDRPEDQPDVYHTFFALMPLALLKLEPFPEVSPEFALPIEICKKLNS